MRILIIICILLSTQLTAQKPNKNCPDDLSLGCNPVSIPAPDLKIQPGGGRCKIISKSLSSEVKSNVGCDFSIIRTYLLVNSCGETLTCVQHIFWKEDKIPPVL